ncbi:MAG: hypothetical protein FJ271_29405 [Planctomycetes bacterium]|nr:hypothetical protein [Planctomycetota bacterium]
MLLSSILGGDRAEKTFRTSAEKTLLLREVQPDISHGLSVRQVFMRFQNLNLRVLIEDLRRGMVNRGNWSFGDELCPVAHGVVDGRTVGVLHYLNQAVDLPRACRHAAEDLGVPPRFIERFVLGWDGGAMSREWLLDQLEAIWSERRSDADAVQAVIAMAPSTSCRTHM